MRKAIHGNQPGKSRFTQDDASEARNLESVGLFTKPWETGREANPPRTYNPLK